MFHPYIYYYEGSVPCETIRSRFTTDFVEPLGRGAKRAITTISQATYNSTLTGRDVNLAKTIDFYDF